MTVLAIGAHYDDCVYGIPGTLLKLVAQGHRVEILIVLGQQVAAKQQALTTLNREHGVGARFLDFAPLAFSDLRETRAMIAEAAADIAPDQVLMLWPHDTHPDHEAVSSACNAAVRQGGRLLVDPARAKHPRRFYWYDNGPQHTRDFRPNTYVDVTAHWPQALAWLGATLAIVSGVPYDPAHPSKAERDKTSLARYRGLECGTDYAEAMRSHTAYAQDLT